jgi:hypothetical protein
MSAAIAQAAANVARAARPRIQCHNVVSDWVLAQWRALGLVHAVMDPGTGHVIRHIAWDTACAYLRRGYVSLPTGGLDS